MFLNVFGQKVKSVDIVFENCEVLNVLAEDLNYFSVMGITTNIYLNEGRSPENYIQREFSCESFSVGVKKRVMDTQTDFSDRTWRTRMSCDVTWFEVNLEDGNVYKFIAPWPFDVMGNEQWAPKQQTYYFDSKGDLNFFASNNTKDVDDVREHGEAIERGNEDRTTKEYLGVEDDFVLPDSKGGYSTEDACKNCEKLGEIIRESIRKLQEGLE